MRVLTHVRRSRTQPAAASGSVFAAVHPIRPRRRQNWSGFPTSPDPRANAGPPARASINFRLAGGTKSGEFFRQRV
jgi:hypothetical protein